MSNGTSLRVASMDLRTLHRKQGGMVLLIALIMLIAMTMAGLAMMRSMGAGVGVAGNLAFKQTATSVADMGIEVARSWLTSPVRTADDLKANVVAEGYYATWNLGFSPQNYDWSNSKLVTANDGNGNEIRYVIHRLCETGNLAPNEPLQKCATLTTPGAGGSKTGDATNLSTAIQPYFRVTSRVKGPRNTVSFVQVVMY